MSLTLRLDKGEELTHEELDNNQLYLLSRADKGYLNIADYTTKATTTFVTQDEFTALIYTPTEIVKLFNGIAWQEGDIDPVEFYNQTTTRTLVVKFTAIASIEGQNNNEIHFAFFKNGHLWPCSEQPAVIIANNRSHATPFHCTLPLAPDDIVTVRVKNASGTDSVTLYNINIIAEVQDSQPVV
jgi:hypothetical protein